MASMKLRINIFQISPYSQNSKIVSLESKTLISAIPSWIVLQVHRSEVGGQRTEGKQIYETVFIRHVAHRRRPGISRTFISGRIHEKSWRIDRRSGCNRVRSFDPRWASFSVGEVSSRRKLRSNARGDKMKRSREYEKRVILILSPFLEDKGRRERGVDI